MVAAFLLVGCSPKQKNAATSVDEQSIEADSTTVRQTFDSLVVAESRAEMDPAYAESQEYAKSHDDFQEVVGQLTQDMSETDRQLYLLDCAVSAFTRNSQHFATHTSEMADPANQRRMAMYGQKIREYRQVLITSKLDDVQQRRLDSLNALIHF